MKKCCKALAGFMMAVVLWTAWPSPMQAAGGPQSLPCTMESGTLHVDLHDPQVRAAVLDQPLVLAAGLRRQYLDAGYTNFEVPLWQFAFELAGHALLANASQGGDSPKEQEVYQRARVADCGVTQLDEDAQWVILTAQMYYEQDKSMSQICFGM